MLGRLTKRAASRTMPMSSLQQIQCRAQGGFTPSDMPIIKNKWEAAEKVGRICESMKNIAAGALPGCERQLGRARPFGGVCMPLFQLDSEPEVQNILHLAVGTERGMCGAISSSTIRQIDSMINKMPKGIKHKVVTYGRRSAAVGNTMFGQNQVLCVGDVKTRIVTWDTCCAIAEYILFEQEWDKAIIHYNAFENAARFHVSHISIFKKDLAEIIAALQFPSYEVEAEEAVVVENLVEFRLASLIYWTISENAASEQASRLQSMDGAQKNCEEMIVEYERIYQGLRKTKITNELIILALAGALSKMKKA